MLQDPGDRLAGDLGVNVADLDVTAAGQVIEIARFERIAAARTATTARIQDLEPPQRRQRRHRPENDLTPAQHRVVCGRGRNPTLSPPRLSFSALGDPKVALPHVLLPRSACPWNADSGYLLTDTDHGTRHVPRC